MNLFDDTALFNSGELRLKEFNIPDAELKLWEHFFPREVADRYYKILLPETPYKQEEIKIYDKVHLTPRMSVWYGRTRDGSTSRPITPLLEEIKQRVEAATHVQFSSVLLNLYRDGKDGVAWHRDHDRELGPKPIVASVNFGATRPFEIRHKFKQEIEQLKIPLNHGSLLLMAGPMQHYWERRLAKTARSVGPRINLTFRNVESIQF
jgi:alkylated DNA repair dioxygenase AlkB